MLSLMTLERPDGIPTHSVGTRFNGLSERKTPSSKKKQSRSHALRGNAVRTLQRHDRCFVLTIMSASPKSKRQSRFLLLDPAGRCRAYKLTCRIYWRR